jgi:hypothetical protein
MTIDENELIYLLKERPLTGPQLVEMTGSCYSSVLYGLHKLEESGIVYQEWCKDETGHGRSKKRWKFIPEDCRQVGGDSRIPSKKEEGEQLKTPEECMSELWDTILKYYERPYKPKTGITSVRAEK